MGRKNNPIYQRLDEGMNMANLYSPFRSRFWEMGSGELDVE